MVLVSSDFSKELTTSVMWLNERNIDIRCVRFILHKYQSQILVDVQQIIPLPEAESYQEKIKQQSEERREARKSSKDYTRYIFQGNAYNKRKLVLAVISIGIIENKPNNLSDLLINFPQEIRSGGMFVPLSEAQEDLQHDRVFIAIFLEIMRLLNFQIPHNMRFQTNGVKEISRSSLTKPKRLDLRLDKQANNHLCDGFRCALPILQPMNQRNIFQLEPFTLNFNVKF